MPAADCRLPKDRNERPRFSAFPLCRRDDELEAYRGQELWIRVAICSLVYAALWALYSMLVAFFLRTGGEPPQLWHLLYLVPPVILAGATAGFASLDLDFGSGFFHYSLYLLVTALLRMITGPPLWTV